MAHKDDFIIFNQRKIQDMEQLSSEIWIYVVKTPRRCLKLQNIQLLTVYLRFQDKLPRPWGGRSLILHLTVNANFGLP